MVSHYYLGIDGGGTRCRARLTDEHGKILAQAEGGPANVFSAYNAAIGELDALIAQVADKAQLSAAQFHIVAGLAGANVPSVQRRLADWRPLCASLRVVTDVEIACTGAHGGAPGAVFIVGTGSQGACWDGENFTLLGGWGFALSDLGSGAVLGQRALRLALLAHEGVVPASPLTQCLMSRFAEDAETLLLWSQRATTADWGSVVPEIFAAAQQDDIHGLTLVRQSAEEIALMTQPLLARQSGKLALMGGLAQPIAPYLPETLRRLLVSPQGDALSGALELARRACF
ncbi:MULTISPECIES: BadF/BadG/BcrA/BcrD ATPase family protein [Pantoea]|uniref:BadF/BadG/BcrA/BcrD ATPase family protein n=1 Tax=Pantoea TaxID=53335 RepID=UPI00289351EB|nr:BadF/BadG/BcrA/BcrD ATPase family protein [Pantoea sp. UBA5923]